MNHQDHPKSHATDVLIPLIRTAATIGFAVAPCSFGFVIIAVSEQLIRSIVVGDDPEMLVSELQNEFPNDAIEVADENDELVEKVVEMIDHRHGLDPHDETAPLPLESRGSLAWMRVRDALKHLLPGTTVRCASPTNLH